MLTIAHQVREIQAGSAEALSDQLLSGDRPVIVRDLAAQWPAVQAARQSSSAAIDYLRRLYRGEPVVVLYGEPEAQGRFFYNRDLSGFNFEPHRNRLDTVLDQIVQAASHPRPPGIYVGSTAVDECLPGFRQHNDIPLGERQALASIWIGNRTRIAAHHDLPDNLACVVAGRRRFTLFPPTELANLYIGPLDFTPAGQAISLVDFAAPDFERFPRFADALKQAQVAELNPGDALFIPSMWWHHVESLDPFNVLLNYWWRQSPAYMDTPMTAMMLAVMSIRDLPPAQRDAWRNMFDHYVFGFDDERVAHIPPQARRALNPFDAASARGLRAELLKRLNR